jgi:polysaccharide biosynthesis/export protein
MNCAVATGHLAVMRTLVVMLVLLGSGACGDNPPVTYPSTPLGFDETKLALGPGDKIELTIFYGSKESKATYSLDSSGQMEVQYIGTVSAGGKALNQVQQEIQKRLADGYLNDPIVSMSVVEYNSLKCSVFGQVMHSGTVRYAPKMTIVDAIAESGGFAPLARKNMVKVTRTLEGKQEIYKIPVELIGEGQRPNFQLVPGDEVYVPERAW